MSGKVFRTQSVRSFNMGHNPVVQPYESKVGASRHGVGVDHAVEHAVHESGATILTTCEEVLIEEEFPANSRKKGGAVGRKLDDALDLLNEACTYNNLGLGFSTESRREAVIRGLIFYLGEETEDLIKDHQVQNTPLTLLQVSAPPVQDEVVQSKMADGLAVRCFYTSLHEYTVFEDDDAADVQEALPTFVLNIFVVTRARDGVLHKRAGIAVEGTEELFGIPDVARACASLMGLICTLELCYPKKLKYTSTCTPKSRTDGNEGGYSELPVLQLFILNCIFSGSPMHVALLCGVFRLFLLKTPGVYFISCRV
ncbi:hypothetical protein QTP86_016533, partial [Hemibagrus guttatus]